MSALMRKALTVGLLGATLAMPVVLAQRKGSHKSGSNRPQGGKRGGAKKAPIKGGRSGQ
jgi:hypothetical protein